VNFKLKQGFYSASRWVVCCLWLGAISLQANPLIDTSSPISFFTNTANLFLKTSGYPFTVSNIPIYPTNCYTPSVHRLLQLAANLYDASTNRAFEDGSSPNGPFYPSVFRPTFNSDGTNVCITGYVEDVETVPVDTSASHAYNILPLSLPDDLASVSSNTVNIYGIPWVIGARKGFPNFNEFSMNSIAQITRKVQIVKPSIGSSPPTWVTNIQYIVGISNVLGVEAWNSYAATYSRAIDIIGVDYLSMMLTNEYGVLVFTNFLNPNPGLYFGPTNGPAEAILTIQSNQWTGYNVAVNNPLYNVGSFQIPLYTNVALLPELVYHPAQSPVFNTNTVFDQGLGYIQPSFGLNITNRLRFAMIDHLTGHLLDFVHFDNMNFHRNLIGEWIAPNLDDGGPWDTNRYSYPNGPIVGVINQIQISQGISNIPGYMPFTANDWIVTQIQPVSQASAVQAFRSFVDGADTTNLSMQVPYVPTRKVSVYFTRQANDPLVHYTLSDLTPLPLYLGIQTNYPALNSNLIALPNIGIINTQYSPWENLGNSPNLSTNKINLAVKDPLIIDSDAWQFPSNLFQNLSQIGNVHRGTPWQTVYLKSALEDTNGWALWTGNTNPFDYTVSLPINDWALVGALIPRLNTQDPRTLYSLNPSDPNALFPAFQGLTVISNSPDGVVSFTLDDTANSNSIAQVIAGINATRASQPGQIFTNLGQILATPQLSVASPFLGSPAANDAAYESLSAQLLPLLRQDSLGSFVATTNPFQIQFTGFDGYAYIVQGSTDLQNWTPLATLYPTNGVISFSDPVAPGVAQKYYRTVLAPPGE
jgi:hypothetical protein